MRLGDADRERLYQQLSAHAAAGRIDLAELERRIEVVAAAEDSEEAMVALADLPALPDAGTTGAAPPHDRPRWGRGHGDADRPQPDWQATPERFRDPKTGRVMRVWVDGTGARHYVAE